MACVPSGLGRRLGGLVLVRAPVDNVIRGWHSSNVAESVKAIGCVEDDGARADLYPLAVGESFTLALAENDEFFIHVAMRRMRALAWVEGGDVHL